MCVGDCMVLKLMRMSVYSVVMVTEYYSEYL